MIRSNEDVPRIPKLEWLFNLIGKNPYRGSDRRRKSNREVIEALYFITEKDTYITTD